MELCSKGHEEVCYESRLCPVCDAIAAAQDKDDRIAELIRERDDAIDELSGAQ